MAKRKRAPSKRREEVISVISQILREKGPLRKGSIVMAVMKRLGHPNPNDRDTLIRDCIAMLTRRGVLTQTRQKSTQGGKRLGYVVIVSLSTNVERGESRPNESETVSRDSLYLLAEYLLDIVLARKRKNQPQVIQHPKSPAWSRQKLSLRQKR